MSEGTWEDLKPAKFLEVLNKLLHVQSFTLFAHLFCVFYIFLVKIKLLEIKSKIFPSLEDS